MPPTPWTAYAALCFSVLAVPTASAQTTRTEELEQKRAQKSAQLREYEPGRIERLLLSFRRAGAGWSLVGVDRGA